MQANKGKNTRPEVELRKLLRQAGYPGYRLHWKQAPGHPDIAYPGRRLAIFVHGCFWHRCPTCDPPVPKANRDFWESKFTANQTRDAAKEEELRAAGWRIAVVWECELRSSPNEAVQRILDLLRDVGR